MDALLAAVDGLRTERVDDLLEHGRIRATLSAEGPGERAEFAGDAWGPAGSPPATTSSCSPPPPDRIRGCAHEACTLHFFDISRNGTRLWCSMAAGGNRAKASRHYARTKEA